MSPDSKKNIPTMGHSSKGITSCQQPDSKNTPEDGTDSIDSPYPNVCQLRKMDTRGTNSIQGSMMDYNENYAIERTLADFKIQTAIQDEIKKYSENLTTDTYNPTHDITVGNFQELHKDEESIINNTKIYEMINYVEENLNKRKKLQTSINKSEKNEQTKAARFIQETYNTKGNLIINEKKAAFMKTSATFSSSFKYNKRQDIIACMSPMRKNPMNKIIEEESDDINRSYKRQHSHIDKLKSMMSPINSMNFSSITCESSPSDAIRSVDKPKLKKRTNLDLLEKNSYKSKSYRSYDTQNNEKQKINLKEIESYDGYSSYRSNNNESSTNSEDSRKNFQIALSSKKVAKIELNHNSRSYNKKPSQEKETHNISDASSIDSDDTFGYQNMDEEVDIKTSQIQSLGIESPTVSKNSPGFNACANKDPQQAKKSQFNKDVLENKKGSLFAEFAKMSNTRGFVDKAKDIRMDSFRNSQSGKANELKEKNSSKSGTSSSRSKSSEIKSKNNDTNIKPDVKNKAGNMFAMFSSIKNNLPKQAQNLKDPFNQSKSQINNKSHFSNEINVQKNTSLKIDKTLVSNDSFKADTQIKSHNTCDLRQSTESPRNNIKASTQMKKDLKNLIMAEIPSFKQKSFKDLSSFKKSDTIEEQPDAILEYNLRGKSNQFIRPKSKFCEASFNRMNKSDEGESTPKSYRSRGPNFDKNSTQKSFMSPYQGKDNKTTPKSFIPPYLGKDNKTTPKSHISPITGIKMTPKSVFSSGLIKGTNRKSDLVKSCANVSLREIPSTPSYQNQTKVETLKKPGGLSSSNIMFGNLLTKMKSEYCISTKKSCEQTEDLEKLSTSQINKKHQSDKIIDINLEKIKSLAMMDIQEVSGAKMNFLPINQQINNNSRSTLCKPISRISNRESKSSETVVKKSIGDLTPSISDKSNSNSSNVISVGRDKKIIDEDDLSNDSFNMNIGQLKTYDPNSNTKIDYQTSEKSNKGGSKSDKYSTEENFQVDQSSFGERSKGIKSSWEINDNSLDDSKAYVRKKSTFCINKVQLAKLNIDSSKNEDDKESSGSSSNGNVSPIEKKSSFCHKSPFRLSGIKNYSKKQYIKSISNNSKDSNKTPSSGTSPVFVTNSPNKYSSNFRLDNNITSKVSKNPDNKKNHDNSSDESKSSSSEERRNYNRLRKSRFSIKKVYNHSSIKHKSNSSENNTIDDGNNSRREVNLLNNSQMSFRNMAPKKSLNSSSKNSKNISKHNSRNISIDKTSNHYKKIATEIIPIRKNFSGGFTEVSNLIKFDNFLQNTKQLDLIKAENTGYGNTTTKNIKKQYIIPSNKLSKTPDLAKKTKSHTLVQIVNQLTTIKTDLKDNPIVINEEDEESPGKFLKKQNYSKFSNKSIAKNQEGLSPSRRITVKLSRKSILETQDRQTGDQSHKKIKQSTFRPANIFVDDIKNNLMLDLPSENTISIGGDVKHLDESYLDENHSSKFSL